MKVLDGVIIPVVKGGGSKIILYYSNETLSPWMKVIFYTFLNTIKSCPFDPLSVYVIICFSRLFSLLVSLFSSFLTNSHNKILYLFPVFAIFFPCCHCDETSLINSVCGSKSSLPAFPSPVISEELYVISGLISHVLPATCL